MELNVWMSSTVAGIPSYSAAERLWTITVSRNGVTRTLHPRHIVVATGHSGEPNIPQFPGVEDFKGDRLCHSSQFSGAKFDSTGLKAVIIGCCNSAHDIAQDYYERGAEATMVQRSSTYVMSSENGLEVLMGKLYAENGVSITICCLLYERKMKVGLILALLRWE
jgi:cation diffusion facilitator CzcD-associated flavoprotein CzcO